MSEGKIIQGQGAKYSEMLINIINKFDAQLPENLSFVDIIETAIEAWNLANNKASLVAEGLYEKELKEHKHYETIDKMVSYKLQKFPDYRNRIVDYSLEDNRLQIKSQTVEEYFNSMFGKILLPRQGIEKKASIKSRKK